MKKFHYVYITTNLVNGKQYAGDHSTDNLDDNYLGSGNLKNAIKKYGKQNFKKEILEYFNERNEAFIAQEKYIKQFNTLSPNGYNISPKGGLGFSGCHSEETKKKMSLALKGRISSMKGKKHSNETKFKMSIAQKGRKLSIERIEQISKSHLGYVVKDETKLKISNSLKGIKRNPFTEEHKTKIGQGNKGKILSNETKLKISEHHWRKNKLIT
jgi:hypothetical protein